MSNKKSNTKRGRKNRGRSAHTLYYDDDVYRLIQNKVEEVNTEDRESNELTTSEVIRIFLRRAINLGWLKDIK